MNPNLQYPLDAVFIVGTSRSGTTLMQTLLNASEDIRICPETKFLGKVMTPYYQYPSLLRRGRRSRILKQYVTAPFFQDSGVDSDRYLESMNEVSLSDTAGLAVLLAAFSKKHTLTRVGEKTPGHLYIAHRLLEEFPGSKLVAMVRDPRAVYASIIKTPFKPERLSTFVVRWKRAFQLVQALKRLYPARVLPVSYEELVETPMEAMRRVTHFVDVKFSEQMLRPSVRHLQGIDFRREPWKANVTNPITPSSNLKWKTELSDANVSLIERCCHMEISSIRRAAAASAVTSRKDLRTIWISLLSRTLQLKWRVSRFPWKREVAARLAVESRYNVRNLNGTAV